MISWPLSPLLLLRLFRQRGYLYAMAALGPRDLTRGKLHLHFLIESKLTPESSAALRPAPCLPIFYRDEGLPEILYALFCQVLINALHKNFQHRLFVYILDTAIMRIGVDLLLVDNK